MMEASATRLGDFLDFVPLSKFFVKVSISLIILVKSFLGNFYKHLESFSGHTDGGQTNVDSR